MRVYRCLHFLLSSIIKSFDARFQADTELKSGPDQQQLTTDHASYEITTPNCFIMVIFSSLLHITFWNYQYKKITIRIDFTRRKAATQVTTLLTVGPIEKFLVIFYQKLAQNMRDKFKSLDKSNLKISRLENTSDYGLSKLRPHSIFIRIFFFGNKSTELLMTYEIFIQEANCPIRDPFKKDDLLIP